MPPPAIRIREVEETDAEALLALHRGLDQETAFMLFEPGERSADGGAERERIRDVRSRVNQTLLVADAGDRLVGYIAVLGGPLRRNRHSAHVMIGVLEAFSGQGIGGALLDAAIRWASNAGLHRLELTVMAHNYRAIRLYDRKGFLREGIRSRSLRVREAWVDEIFMARLLPPP
jgi:RimJ/RimL family protein N-acetyltransferase